MILLLEIQYLMGWCGPFPQGCAPENGRTKTGTHPSARRPCIAAGANVLVAGSAVYKAEDIPARIKELRGK